MEIKNKDFHMADKPDEAVAEIFWPLIHAAYRESEKAVVATSELLNAAHKGMDYLPNTAFMVAAKLIYAAAFKMACMEAGTTVSYTDPLVGKYMKVFSGTLMHFPGNMAKGREFFVDSMNAKGTVQ